MSRPVSTNSCPGQHCSRLSTLLGQKSRVPAPLWGASRVRSSSRKTQTFIDQYSSVFAPEEVILGVLSTSYTPTITGYRLIYMRWSSFSLNSVGSCFWQKVTFPYTVDQPDSHCSTCIYLHTGAAFLFPDDLQCREKLLFARNNFLHY